MYLNVKVNLGNGGHVELTLNVPANTKQKDRVLVAELLDMFTKRLREEPPPAPGFEAAE